MLGVCGVRWWSTREAGLGKLKDNEVKEGEEHSLDGGVMTLQGHYVNDMHACIIL